VNLDFFEDLDGVAAKLAAGPAKDYGQRHGKPVKVNSKISRGSRIRPAKD
jgi:hypothetical protein